MDQILSKVTGGGMLVSFSSMKLRCCGRTDTGRHVTRERKIGGLTFPFTSWQVLSTRSPNVLSKYRTFSSIVCGLV